MRRLGEAVLAATLAATLTSCFAQADPEELSIYGPYVGPEADIFAETLASFEAATGITTSYVGSSSFQSDFSERMVSADLTDVTIIPQLALLGVLIDDGHLRPMGPEASDLVLETTGEFWAPLIAPDGAVLTIPYRFVVKSIVWYRADVFQEEGYDIPTTLAELKGLTRQMVADGNTPWCSGMDSSSATGWWATDWVEDLVVRRSGPDTYWSWAALETPFTDGAVVGAMQEFQEIVNTEGAFLGGRRGILNNRVEDAISPMFDEVPGCLMHKQASFQPVWLPPDVSVGDAELDIFPLPGIEPGDPPIMISGEFVAATSDNPAATEFLEFLLTDEAFQPWLDVGGSLVARAELPESPEGADLDSRLADMVEAAETVVLDASDLMPQSVGTGTFFEGMIELVAGKSASEVGRDIQDSVDALD